MGHEKRLIGEAYDKDRFSAGFRRAAYAIVSESYQTPEIPTAQTLQEMLVHAMERNMEAIPTVYYQMLETAMEGRDLSEVAVGDTVEKWNRMGDARLGKLMMDMAKSVDEAGLSPKDEVAAEAYYDGLFPLRARERAAEETETAHRRRLDLSRLPFRERAKEEKAAEGARSLPETSLDEKPLETDEPTLE